MDMRCSSHPQGFSSRRCASLDHAAAIAKAAEANVGNLAKAVEIANDVNQPVTPLLNAASLMNRIYRT